MFRRSQKATHTALRSAAMAAVLLGPAALLPMTGLAPHANAQQNVEPQVDPAVTTAVGNFWHFGKIGRYDVAVLEGEKILASGAEPRQLLNAFEAVAASRGDVLEQWLVRWSQVDNPQMKEQTSRITELLNQGRFARRSDPAYIDRNIQRLVVNELAYRNAIAELRDSGELAVPLMVEYLRDPARSEYHARIRRALQDMGRLALNPLLAATEMQDPSVLPGVLTVLGDLGYDAALPYLARIAQGAETAPQIKAAAERAMGRIAGSTGDATAANLYAKLAEELYYDRAAVTTDPRNPSAYVWYWSENAGLTKVDVPAAIFNEVMAMRAAEYALKLGDDAAPLALWLVANYKREAELPEGAADSTRGQDQPDAHYYGVTAGVDYLYTALERALSDRDSAVSLKIIRSLQEIVGESSLRGGDSPLVDALSYADRRVRFEAAFALAGALPRESFVGQERVVPIMAEALAQTGQPNVIVVVPSSDSINALVEPLQASGLNVRGVASADQVRQVSEELAAVDVIVMFDTLEQSEIESVRSFARSNGKLNSAAQLVVTRTSASPFVELADSEPLLSTTTAAAGDGLREAILTARESAGALPLDEEIAAEYATRAAAQLREVAVNAGDVYELTPGKDSLLAALSDDRLEIVELAGQVVAYLNVPEAQVYLLRRAEDQTLPDDVRVTLYKSLALNAKFFGPQLPGDDLPALETTVRDAQSLEVRSSAAEARGALNLPVEQAEQLVVDQSRV